MDGSTQMLPLPVGLGHEATLEGRVRRIVFDSNSGTMRVFEIDTEEGAQETVRQYGNGAPMIPLRKGDQVRVMGRLVNHHRFGRQFDAKEVLRHTPTSAKGVAKVISGKEFKGIGPKIANKVLDAFGPELLSILNRGDPGELISDLIGDKKARTLIDAWRANQAVNMTDSMLAELDIGPETRKKIRETIQDVETVIQTDPYRLAKEVDGIGFMTADKLAMRAQVFREDSPSRLAGGIHHALELAGNDGHTGLSRAQLIDKTCDALRFGDRMLIGEILDKELKAGDLQTSPNDLIQDRRTAIRETKLAKLICDLSRAEAPLPIRATSIMRRLAQVRERFSLTEEQFQAVAAACQSSFSVVTGGPGTGKTTTVRAIIWVIETAASDEGVSVAVKLFAPTGKAADRLSESTSREASTLHSGLGRDPDGGGFFHNASNPFECDIVIADEWSMVDTRMAESFLSAINPKRTRLIMVGDVDQLASVDPGRVLHDVIQSSVCPVTRFTIVHRTGAGSAIALGAARINKGEMPDFGRPGESDFVFIPIEDPEEASARIVKMVSESLPNHSGVSPSDIQVLSPGKNSAVGTNALNLALQNALNRSDPIRPNPSAPPISISSGQKPRIGDKVICNRNSRVADRDGELVFNGDVGTIESHETGFGDDNEPLAWLHLKIGSKKRLNLERSYWNNIALAYALTIHKSQGSEYPIVVIPMTTSHYMMLKRNLFYTGVTRAKRMCIVVGSKRAIMRALATTDGTSRQTGLLSRIKRFAKLN